MIQRIWLEPNDPQIKYISKIFDHEAPLLLHTTITCTVNPNTLWSYFHVDISVTAGHMPTKPYTLT